jgi:hypothetical protein
MMLGVKTLNGILYNSKKGARCRKNRWEDLDIYLAALKVRILEIVL